MSPYERAMKEFRWNIPRRYNLGYAISDQQHAEGHGTAIVQAREGGGSRSYSFHFLQVFSNKLANVLSSDRWARGSRIAVLLPPSVEAAIAHIAIFKAGLVSVPLIAKDTSASIRERLEFAEASAVLTSQEISEAHAIEWAKLPGLQKIYEVSSSRRESDAFLEHVLGSASSSFRVVESSPDDPAILAFTSGTDGQLKAVLHAHRVALSGLPAMLFCGTPKPRDLIWSHFEWGWLGGLLVPFIGWHCGAAVLLHEQPVLDPFVTTDLWRQLEVTRISIAPTVLRMMQQTVSGVRVPTLNSITSGGERLDSALRDWVFENMGVGLSEIYGLSECGAVLGYGDLLPARVGSLGKPPPGQNVGIISLEGQNLSSGETGYIAVQTPHPQMFLGYWRDPVATRNRHIGSRFNTGDMAYVDGEGYFWYVARDAEIIKVGGHRIAPAEVERAFVSHPMVDACVAIGVPDPLSGDAIVAWIKLAKGCVGSQQTEGVLLRAARQMLAPYKVPRRVRFVEEIPSGATDKIDRRKIREQERVLMSEQGR